MDKKIKIALATGGIAILGIGSYAIWNANNTKTTTQNSSTTRTSTTTQAIAASTSSTKTIDWTTLATNNITLSDQVLSITEAGTYVLTGSTNAGVTVNTTGDARIILNGATITSSADSAINVKNASSLTIEIADGTNNIITDASTRNNEDTDGAIYSTGQITITGSGNLTINGKYENGISAESVTVNGGNLTFNVVDKGITTTGQLVVNDGTITVKTSEEGLEGAQVIINGGTIDIYATDDGINARSDTDSDIYIKITGGDITVEVASGDTDAIDSNGNIYMSGGNLTITAPTSSFDFDGTAEYTGGNITVNGKKVTSITNSMPAGGGGAGGPGGAAGPGRRF